MKATYWLKLNDFKPYRVDQDRFLTIRERAGLSRESKDFEGLITSTKQPIKGWVEPSNDRDRTATPTGCRYRRHRRLDHHHHPPDPVPEVRGRRTVITESIRAQYDAAILRAQQRGSDRLEELDRAGLIFTRDRLLDLLHHRGNEIEGHPLHRFLPPGVTVETATLKDVQRGIAEWLRNSY